ncbi:MAG: peptide chain release factor 3 [Pseudomonadota bacterium]
MSPRALTELNRRTFAIISHPDAGKTTLTEKLLLAGGAIHMAGEVKARGDNRRARSDWMKIEQERGISVTSSVMTFEHEGLVLNLLDTPGHEDFSEDTYRTLTAVDSAIMVIDAARGIQSQTRKLFEVCRLRNIPIMTFINKVDREGRDGFELLDEIHDSLQLEIAPMVWPVGMGSTFHGLWDLRSNEFLTASTGANQAGVCDTRLKFEGIDDSALDAHIAADVLERERENIALAGEGYPPFDADAYREGYVTPVVFGSALRNFGVSELLSLIAAHAPRPRPSPVDRPLSDAIGADHNAPSVDPHRPKVSGFVFKVQANMDKNHRDRVAFMRLCSGHFKRGMKLRQVRSGKDIMVHSPIFFMAQSREVVQDAYPGDVIGIPNHGTVRVGDTFTEGEHFRFTGLPVFAPEILRRVRHSDPSRTKQLRSALEDLAEEGLVQLFKPQMGAQFIVGVVGVLQLDVLASRAKAEYGVEIAFEPIPYSAARWLKCDDDKALAAFIKLNQAKIVHDRDEHPVFLTESAWDLDYFRQKNESIEFLATKELS